jgi:hypothetical protein
MDKRILAYHGTHNSDIYPAQFANRKIVAPDHFKLHRTARLRTRLFMGIAVAPRHRDNPKQGSA